MAKYYDIYTQIPGIKPCPQMWIVEGKYPDSLASFNSGLMKAENIVGTTAKSYPTLTYLSASKNISSAWSNRNMGVMTNETIFNYAIVVSFFSLVAVTIWIIWDQREVVINTFYTALIVFTAVLVCKEVWIIAKEL